MAVGKGIVVFVVGGVVVLPALGRAIY